MRLLTDITPLRESPVFRRLWIGSMLSSVGSAMTNFAMTLQVWDVTRSTAAVGGLGVATFVPMLVIALPGGTLADRVDRRKLVLAATTCQTALSAVLFAQALVGLHSLWLLYALEALFRACAAISQPARRTFIPALVRSGSFAGSFYGVGRLPAMRAVKTTTAKPERSDLALTAEGLFYIWRNRVLAGTFLADLNATFFGLPLALFPAINALRFGGDPRILGLFTTAGAVAIGAALPAFRRYRDAAAVAAADPGALEPASASSPGG